MRRRDAIRGLGLALSTACLPTARAEGGYPKPGTTLRYVVPFAPGGLTDVLARLVGERLAQRWGITVLVDNRPGGAGQIGADAVAKSPGDGSVLLAITLAHAANVTFFKGRSRYDLQRDLKPVALLAGSPMLIVVPAESPIRDTRDLLARAKERPLNTGSSGNGTAPHLALALFSVTQKVALQHVPYKGGAPSMADLVGGQLDLVFSNLPESLPHVKAGRLRALATTSIARLPQLPDVPTTAEVGWPDVQVENWTAIMAPATMPDAIVARIGAEAVAIMKLPDVAERAGGLGFRVDARGPSEFRAFLKAEIERWAGIITAARIEID